VGADLDNAALMEDNDLIGLVDGRESVGDDDGGAAQHECVEAALDGFLCFAVEGTSGLIEDDHGRIFQEDAGDGEALSLSA